MGGRIVSGKRDPTIRVYLETPWKLFRIRYERDWSPTALDFVVEMKEWGKGGKWGIAGAYQTRADAMERVSLEFQEGILKERAGTVGSDLRELALKRDRQVEAARKKKRSD